MSMLKGNYGLEGPARDPQPHEQQSALEKEYYKAALSKLGGSIAFIMKGQTFLWTGDDGPPADAPAPAPGRDDTDPDR